MMGQQGGGQDRLFYSFNLDEHVPPDHLLRGINQFLDLSDLRQYLAGYYSNTGRPSIDPELMIRMLVIGYCFSSERAVRRGSPESGVSLVLPLGTGRQYSGSLDVLQESPRSLPRQ